MKNYELYKTEPIDNLKEMIKKCVDKYGARDAIRIISNDKYISKTYEQLAFDINAFGTALRGLDLYGKHIAVIGDNSYEWIVTYLAVVNGVGVIVPIDKELPPDEIEYIIEHGDVSAIVYSDICKERILQIEKQLLNVKYSINISDNEGISDHLDFSTLLESGAKTFEKGNSSYLDTEINPENLCSILYTSGTTGTSKGVMLTHRNFTSVIVGGLNNLEINDSVLSVLPFHHSYESVCGIFSMIYNGSVIYINDSLINFMNNLKQFKPANIFLVPALAEAMYKGIWDNTKKSNKDKLLIKLVKVSNALLKIGIDIRKILFKKIHEAFGGNIEILISGGAPLSPTLAKGFRELGFMIINAYGITECSPGVAINRNKYFNDSSVGTIISCCKVKIDISDQDGNGEILVKGDNVMLSYYKNDKATKEAFTEDRWFRTGDYGHLDENGFLYITGRKKNLIVLKNGKNVYPEEIEGYLLNCSLIKEVVVYSKEEEEGKESFLIAEIFPNIDYAKLNGIIDIEQAITEEVNTTSEKLPYYKRVSKIIIREKEFEKTSTKKIKRFKINNKSISSSLCKNNEDIEYVKPENELQKLIEQIMCRILKMDKISIKHDLFEFGLDSLGVIEAITMLSANGIQLNAIDFYKGKTIKDIAKIINSLDIKDVCSNIQQDVFDSIMNQSFKSKSEIKNVLLTGASGYLGSHILEEIINTTTATVYCLVRNKESFYETLNFYFKDNLTKLIEGRIKVIIGDITTSKLGLLDKDYSYFVRSIDTVIHSAANVRHITDISEAEKVNVYGTENIIKFAKDANAIYHHISTMAISGEVVLNKSGEVIFDETKLFIGQDYNKNVYIQSKFKAEEIVLQQIKEGLDGRIYRVGNLTWCNDGKFQKNINENGFIMRLSAFLKIGAYPLSMSDYEIDFTPVNKCAEAVVKIVTKNDSNRIYHIYNNNTANLKDVLNILDKSTKGISDEEFFKLMLKDKDNKDVSVLMFYLNEFIKNKNSGAIVKLNNEKTIKTLENLGFTWFKITDEYINLFNRIVLR